MSHDWVADNHDMHVKFGMHQAVEAMDDDTLNKFLELRVEQLEEELNEFKDADTAEKHVDALIDLCVFAIGTLDLFGVDAHKAWNEVHRANMAKEVGVKPEKPGGRKNPFKLPDLIKPAGWTPVTHAGNYGHFSRLSD
jgi:predicted HAD superfamily Cof-like phosphohydrolase